jgi:hypothetical protein
MCRNRFLTKDAKGGGGIVLSRLDGGNGVAIVYSVYSSLVCNLLYYNWKFGLSLLLQEMYTTLNVWRWWYDSARRNVVWVGWMWMNVKRWW